jgi:hypothetical protein
VETCWCSRWRLAVEQEYIEKQYEETGEYREEEGR